MRALIIEDERRTTTAKKTLTEDVSHLREQPG
jgi:hypothetical protein